MYAGRGCNMPPADIQAERNAMDCNTNSRSVVSVRVTVRRSELKVSFTISKDVEQLQWAFWCLCTFFWTTVCDRTFVDQHPYLGAIYNTDDAESLDVYVLHAAAYFGLSLIVLWCWSWSVYFWVYLFVQSIWSRVFGRGKNQNTCNNTWNSKRGKRTAR